MALIPFPRYFFGYLLLLAILLFSCKQQNSQSDESTATASDEPLHFKLNQYQKTAGDCSNEGKTCLKINFRYPIAYGGEDSIRDNINAYILSFLIQTLEFEEPEEPAETFEEAVQKMIVTHKEYLEESAGYGSNWTFDINGSYKMYKNNALIKLPSSSQTGGAHPNHYTALINFDLATGEEIIFEDLILDKKAFRELASKYFYTQRKKTDGDDFDKDQFFWDKKFYLPENYGITEKGIQLLYNPYEAAPYVLGATDFTIPYKRLEDIIQKPIF